MNKLASSLSMGDIHVISLRSGFDGLVVPSKAYGALAVGKPILDIGTPHGEIARMILEEDIGNVVPAGDFFETARDYFGNMIKPVRYMMFKVKGHWMFLGENIIEKYPLTTIYG